ncbi:MAG: hypothetical protein ACRDWI_08385 [Jiangellaceae bacterium]
MSHDIDLIVNHTELAQITAVADEISESRHFAGRKWRGSINDIHIDLYLPHQSRLGARLKVRVEHLLPHVETIDGWTVLSRPAHFVTKLAALLDRPDTLPGQKDRRELLALLNTGIDQGDVIEILRDAADLAEIDLPDLIQEAFTYLAEDLDSKDARRRLRTTATFGVRAAQPRPT